jgi:hypothetical protein
MSQNEANAVIITADGNAEIRYVRTDLDSIKAILDGGWLEPIGPLTDEFGEWHAYVDEEGKIKGLPINHAATKFARDIGWGSHDVLCGPVVFLGRGGTGEDGGVGEGDVPDEVIAAVLAFYREFGEVNLG